MKTPTTLLPLALLVLLSTTGCATLFKSKTEAVTFQSSPADAEVWLDGGYRGNTPLVLELKPRKEPSVIFKKAGYKDQSAPLTTSVSIPWVAADVAGGFVAIGIDAMTGNWNKFDSTLVNVSLTPAEKPEEVEDAADAQAPVAAAPAPGAPAKARRATPRTTRPAK